MARHVMPGDMWAADSQPTKTDIFPTITA
jgi:hypothetical protein